MADPTLPAAGREPLLAEFPPVDRDTWKAQVEAELKGAPFDKKMFSTTYEGITLRPIYRREDAAGLAHAASLPGFPPYVRGSGLLGHAGKPWEVSQEIAVPDATAFNDAARSGLGRGLTALNIVLDRATRNGADPDWAPEADIGRGGLSVATRDDLRSALKDIDLARVPLFVRSGASGMPVAALLAALVRERGLDPAVLRGCIEVDPLGVLAHEGRLAVSLEGAYAEMAALTAWASSRAPALQTICVHTRAWHESGGHAVQELGFGLATALEYLRAMAARGLDLERVAPRLRFAFTVGSRFFVEIAKLRAARMLWARLVSVLGGSTEAQKTTLHVRTALFDKTVHDPHVNLLRTTVEAFAGVLGGCDSLQVGAFDEVVRSPDEFSQRMARNQQLVLRDECQLTHVADPAGGSWYVESLTAELAGRAWALFQEIERRGGMAKAMHLGWPQEETSKVAAVRLANVAKRRDSIVGTNVYANLAEKPLDPRTSEIEAANFRARRARQVASARTLAEPAHHQVVLEKLADVVGKRDVSLFDA
ncbi:MAG: acyl-CoA mutase large subunit family protein, partial [Verrucomicrobiales bacterium]|nr:acyl-CoA mutase large subunit family protein [Verrucomicrobiales bacterium]